MDNIINSIKSLIDNANKIVFLTGAGVSTHSGIPDYRSVDGIYSKSPMEMLSREYFDENPLEVSNFILDKLKLKDSKPNMVHQWIASLGDKASVITQNIDGLHERSGSDTVAFHGTANNWKCLSCKKHHTIDMAINSLVCECGGILEPAVVFYGDRVPYEAHNRAIELVRNADLIIIVGASMKVYPFADLLYDAGDINIVEINKEKASLMSNIRATVDCMDVAKALLKDGN